MPKNESSQIIENRDDTIELVNQISKTMSDYIKNHTESNFICFSKTLTHSDIATFGKATKKDHLGDDLLYYFSVNELRDIEKQNGKPFQTAHQSNIGLTEKLYKKIGIPEPRNSEPYLLNDVMDVYLVNETIKYFQPDYTKQIIEKLDKKIKEGRLKYWDYNNLEVKMETNVVNGNSGLTPINLHVAVHGIGTQNDIEFHKLRHHMFCSDSIILIFEINDNNKKMFILLDKNPLFFEILNEEGNYFDFIKQQGELINKIKKEQIKNLDAAKDKIKKIEKIQRTQQNAWRNMLIKEMLAYTEDGKKIFCPITRMTADPSLFSPLFVASHIKEYSDSQLKEKYDLNNGLILSNTADALFDKHLITIGKNKELILSCLFNEDKNLIKTLKIDNGIFKPLLNDERMKYLEYHREEFYKKEEERKKKN